MLDRDVRPYLSTALIFVGLTTGGRYVLGAL